MVKGITLATLRKKFVMTFKSELWKTEYLVVRILSCQPSSGLLSLLLIMFTSCVCVCVCVSVIDGNGGTHSRSTSDITTPPSSPTALLKPNNDILNGELMRT